ncbi:hypothetical protein ABIE66_000287 [Peribacillus sp. B2I2]|uniref:hypothetical protein n=1 Tax=Peribacillus sp. B2I2 TaxID=3156468 RepID=UPI003516DFAC
MFVSLLAPKRLIGIAGGTFIFIGGTASIIIPIVIGFLAKGGDFAPALTFITCIPSQEHCPTFSWSVKSKGFRLLLILIYVMVRSYRANYDCVEYLQTTKQCIPKIGITALLFVIHRSRKENFLYSRGLSLGKE